MMQNLRGFASSWVMKAFLGLLILSFAIWGIGDVFRGFGERDVLQIGSVRVSVDQFRMLYNDRMQRLSRQFGRGLTPAQARSLGIDRQILSELASETAMDEKARALGLALSDETLSRHIQNNPMFRGAGGTFDPIRFAELLRTNGFSEARYVDSERRLLLRQQIGRSLSGDLEAPAVLREAVRRYQSEERGIEFVSLGRAQAGTIATPSQTELASYFETRKASFRAPEYRKLTVLALTPETIATGTQITDADLRKEFDARRDRFSTPERREVEQIVFPNLDEAKAAAQRLAAGAKFEAIVAERGLAPADVNLGLVGKRDILDRAVADAAFALAPGKLSELVAGRFGTVLLRVTRIEPGKEPSFTEVAGELRKQLGVERARQEVFDRHDKIEDERAAGATLSEVASKLGLKLTAIASVDRSGRTPEGKRVEEVPVLEQLLEGAFASQVGVEIDPIEIRGSGGFVWYEVAGITQSRDRPLDEVRARVEERWRDEETAKRLAERAEAIRTRLDAGERIEAVAAGLKVEKREQLKRGQAAEGIDNRALAAVFETAQGKPAVAVSADGVERIVFRVTSVRVPAGDGQPAETALGLGGALQEDLLLQYLTRLRDDLGVRVNEAALRTVIGDTGN